MVRQYREYARNMFLQKQQIKMRNIVVRLGNYASIKWVKDVVSLAYGDIKIKCNN